MIVQVFFDGVFMLIGGLPAIGIAALCLWLRRRISR